MQLQGPSLIQTQTQKLSPQMLQTVKLMAMPMVDLKELINQEIENNPALEADFKEPKENLDDFPDINGADIDINEESSDTDYRYNQSENSVNDFIEGTVSMEESLLDHLLDQLLLTNLSDREETIAHLIINNLNPQGFHIHDPYILLNSYTEDEVKRGIEIVQEFDPVGICVKDIEESLYIQAKIDGTYPDHTLEILKDSLDLIASGKKRVLQDKYNLEKEDLDEIYDYLKTLNPHPTSRFKSSLSNYVIPEARIKKERKDIKVYLKNDSIPSLSINDEFQEYISSSDKDTKKFAKKSISSANTFINSLQMRNSTLLKTLNSIVQKQREFFLFGPGNIKPLTRKEIAVETELSESTISRISADKYVQTDWGIFNIKYFFSNSISSSQGGRDHSKESVKEMVKQIILENKSEKKLSDQKISNILKERGVNLARRTVSKYRKELNLLSSFER